MKLSWPTISIPADPRSRFPSLSVLYFLCLFDKRTTGTSLIIQEHEAMVETARKLYGVLSQNGEPPLTMMRTMLTTMQPIDFKVTKEAA